MTWQTRSLTNPRAKRGCEFCITDLTAVSSPEVDIDQLAFSWNSRGDLFELLGCIHVTGYSSHLLFTASASELSKSALEEATILLKMFIFPADASLQTRSRGRAGVGANASLELLLKAQLQRGPAQLQNSQY